MKKAFLILAVIFICLMPVTALADSPAPDPNNQYMLIDDYTNIVSVEIWGYDSSNILGQFQLLGSEITLVPHERVISFYNEHDEDFQGKYKNVQIVVRFNNGETATSNLVDIVPLGSYIYSVKDNTLKEGEITTWKPNGFVVFLGAIVLIFPMLFTVLVEWIVSLFFKLKPDKYVIIINFITNPVINILLLLIYANFAVNYILLLVILEVIVAAVEFWFYTWKYKGYSKTRLLIFTLVANTASWGLYALLSPLLM